MVNSSIFASRHVVVCTSGFFGRAASIYVDKWTMLLGVSQRLIEHDETRSLGYASMSLCSDQDGIRNGIDEDRYPHWGLIGGTTEEMRKATVQFFQLY